LSSTTDAKGARGQVIVIFALALFTIVIVAALAFDAGQMILEKRDQQNGADAAALAGARYLINEPGQADPGARAIATENGFTNGIDNTTVQVHIPPVSGQFKALPGFVEVVISNRRPSVFGRIIGVTGWNVSARAVAANQQGLDLPFSMLTLHPTDCKALTVTGTGTITSNGSIQVNSECSSNAMDVGGSGTITVTADGATCNAVGGILPHGGGTLNCVQSEDSYAIPDPLKTLAAPPVPPYPLPIEQVAGPSKARPVGCPFSSAPATATNPSTCKFNASYAGTSWRFFPGYYPGGIETSKATVYLEPGIYYIGGGGFKASNGGVYSVDPGLTAPPHGGGILIYNTEAYEFHDECLAGTAPPQACIGAIVLSGGESTIGLLPLNDGSIWDGMVIFQDRYLSVEGGKDVQINGGNSLMEVAGTIYVPLGAVEVNGNAGTMILDQIIAYTFKINGGGGNIDILYRDGVTARISGVGLVE
jgi:Flp pilus assembly protein TadG